MSSDTRKLAPRAEGVVGRVNRWLVRVNPLDAPEGFRWSDDDVQFEKVDSFLNGWIIGLLVGVVLMMTVWMIA